jgi:hypothetical protein
MKVTAYLCEPNDIVFGETPIDLFDIPISENFVSIHDKKYIVCSTLFKEKYEGLEYSFEQIVRPFNTTGEPYHPPHKLILGSVKLDTYEEVDAIFKKVAVHVGYVSHELTVPYNYMRRYDCVEVDRQILFCDQIIVRDNIEIVANTYASPGTLETFRADVRHFCQHIERLHR